MPVCMISWLGEWETKLRVHLNKPAWLVPWRRQSRRSQLDPAHLRNLIQRLRDQKRSLLALTETLESEFLDIGNDLQEMTGLAGSIRVQYDAVLAILSGKEKDSALVFFALLLKKAEDLILASYEQYKHVFSVFKEVEGAVENAVVHQEDLQRVWALLPFIVAQFRIQASRFDAETRTCFFILASEVDALLASVRTEVGHQFEHLNETQILSQKVAADLVNTVIKHRTDVLMVLDASRKQLADLERALADSTSVVHGLFESSQGANRGISRMVRALQIQDSARQKIEHLCEAIDDLEQNLEKAANHSTSTLDGEQLSRTAAQIAFLQRRQIETVFSSLEEEAHEIVGGIQEIHTAMEELVGSASRNSQIALESGVVNQSVTAIRGILEISRTTIAKADNVFECIAPLRSTFLAYTLRITELARSVRLSALNAQIYASNLSGGEALSVLSEQARHVSDLSMEEASSLSKHLDGIGASIELLHQELEGFQTLARAEQSAIQEDAALCEVKLHSLQEDLPRSLAGMSPSLKKLAALATRRASQLKFPQMVVEARRNAVDLFDELMLLGERDSMGGRVPDAGKQLDHLRNRYTMANEREVHENALHELVLQAGMRNGDADNPVCHPSPARSATPKPRAELVAMAEHSGRPSSDLGNNVDFF